MSELINIHARAVKDLTTPTELPADPNALDQVKLVAGNFPAEYAGNEALTVKQIKDLATVDLESKKANKTDVEVALSNLSTTANKFYPTLSEANSHLATMSVNAVATIGEEANKGLWYKATADARTLTKSPYDPLTQANDYTDLVFDAVPAVIAPYVAQAEAAATAATISAGVFETPEAGVDPVTGVEEGEYFNVRSPSSDSYIDEYQNAGGSAIATGKSYLSALGVQQQEKPANTIKDASGKTQQEINNARVVAVDSIADLLALPAGQRKEGLRYLVKGYHAGSAIGGGEFYWDPESTTPEDGGMVFGDGLAGRWLRILTGDTLLLEQFGVKSGVRATVAFNAAQAAAADRGLKISTTLAEVDLGSGAVIYVDTHIPHLSLSGHVRVVSLKTPQELSASGIGGLSEFSGKISGAAVAGMAGKYVHFINNSEELVERYNPPSNIPYYKNTAVLVLDNEGNIFPTLDMGFNDLAGTTVRVFEKEAPVCIRLPHVLFKTSNAAIVVERDSTRLFLGTFERESSDLIVSVSIAANDCHIYDLDLSKANNSGQGYGISVGLSCGTVIENARGFGSRSPIDGRHGANVTLRGCSMQGSIGTHWGNYYRIEDCAFGWVHYAGKDLAIVGGMSTGRGLYGADAYAVTSRSDTSCVLGTLSVENLVLGIGVRHVYRDLVSTLNFTSMPRSWDLISMSGIRSNGIPDTRISLVSILSADAGFVRSPTRVTLKDCDLGKSRFRVTLSSLRGEGLTVDMEGVKAHPSDGNVDVDIKGNDAPVLLLIKDCAETEVTLRVSDNLAQEVKATNVWIRQAFLSGTSQLNFTGTHARIENLATFPRDYLGGAGQITAKFINCEIGGTTVSTGLNVDASIGNLVTNPAFPVSPSYYVSSGYAQPVEGN